jgi:hypothetical protein
MVIRLHKSEVESGLGHGLKPSGWKTLLRLASREAGEPVSIQTVPNEEPTDLKERLFLYVMLSEHFGMQPQQNKEVMK